MRTLLGLTITVAVFYALYCAALWLFQDRLIYFPSASIRATPEAIGLEYHEYFIATSDHQRLHAWYVPHNHARYTLLFFHGNAGNIGDRLESLSLFHNMGMAVLIFDYRGYGKSTGFPTEQGLRRDARAIQGFASKTLGVRADRLIYFGRSLGGAVAINLAKEHPPAALVIESSFRSLADLARKYYPFVPARLILRDKYNSARTLMEIDVPTLIIHSREDEIIPYTHGQALYAAAKGNKQLMTIFGGHNDGFYISGSAYGNGWRQFLDTL